MEAHLFWASTKDLWNNQELVAFVKNGLVQERKVKK